MTPSQSDEIVELQPPEAFGFGGTVKLYRHEHAETIAILKNKGYTVVEHTA